MRAARPVEIFERHHLRVYRFLRRMTADPVVAEDLTQEVFLRAIGALDRYEARGREVSWIFRIARNVLSDRDRRRRRAPETVGDPLPAKLATAGDPTLGFDLEQALALVPAEEREALLLREHGGLGYEEIAGVTGATPAAVRSRIYRARRAMRELLSPVGGTR